MISSISVIRCKFFVEIALLLCTIRATVNPALFDSSFLLIPRLLNFGQLVHILRDIMGLGRLIHNILWSFCLTPVEALGTLAGSGRGVRGLNSASQGVLGFPHRAAVARDGWSGLF